MAGFAGAVVDGGIILIDFINGERREKRLFVITSIISGSKSGFGRSF